MTSSLFSVYRASIKTNMENKTINQYLFMNKFVHTRKRIVAETEKEAYESLKVEVGEYYYNDWRLVRITKIEKIHCTNCSGNGCPTCSGFGYLMQ